MPHSDRRQSGVDLAKAAVYHPLLSELESFLWSRTSIRLGRLVELYWGQGSRAGRHSLRRVFSECCNGNAFFYVGGLLWGSSIVYAIWMSMALGDGRRLATCSIIET
jgi:hypothetical protein